MILVENRADEFFKNRKGGGKVTFIEGKGRDRKIFG
jgi:hypothetical protein